MQIFSNLQHKKQKHSLTGFTLLEVVVSIVLFTILSCFLMAIVPSLIVKFRASAFKEQTIYLAKSKLEEYLYATPAETTPPDSGVLQFTTPYNNFWYRVTMASYGSNTNTNLVTVAVWGPTANQNQTNINRVTLVGLAKIQDSSDTSSGNLRLIYSWSFPDDLRVWYPRVYYDPVNRQIIMHAYYGTGYAHRTDRYNLAGARLVTVHAQAENERFWGWTYNPRINQLIGITTTNGGWAGTGQYREYIPTSAKLVREPNYLLRAYTDSQPPIPSSPGTLGTLNMATFNDTYVNDSIASASNGTTYIIQKRVYTSVTFTRTGTIAVPMLDSLRLYVASPTSSGSLNIQSTVNLWGSSNEISRRIGYSFSDIKSVRTDKNDNVLITTGSSDLMTIECDGNLQNPKILFPAGLRFEDGGRRYIMNSSHVEKDKYGNVYAAPDFMSDYTSGYSNQILGNGSEAGENPRTGNQRLGLYKFRPNGFDGRGNYILQYAGKAVSAPSVLDFTISQDGGTLVTVEGKTTAPFNERNRDITIKVYSIE